LRQYSEDAVAAFGIWDDVFGGTDRLVRVLAAQHDNPWTSKTILRWKRAYDHADALAVAPYWGFPLADPRAIDEVGFDVRTATTDQIIDFLRKHVEEIRSKTVGHARNAERYGLALIAYEGGQHLAPINAGQRGDWTTDPDAIEKLSAVNRDPAMRKLYVDAIQTWRADGGGLYVHYMSPGHSYGRWGSFSIRENQDDPPSPKELGLRDAVDAISSGGGF
jgi:hypothetical protein